MLAIGNEHFTICNEKLSNLELDLWLIHPLILRLGDAEK